MYVRFKLVQAFNNYDRSLRILNKVALFMGALSSLGVSLVANFQVSCHLTYRCTPLLISEQEVNIYLVELKDLLQQIQLSSIIPSSNAQPFVLYSYFTFWLISKQRFKIRSFLINSLLNELIVLIKTQMSISLIYYRTLML